VDLLEAALERGGVREGRQGEGGGEGGEASDHGALL
jgi:hypothetical protein